MTNKIIPAKAGTKNFCAILFAFLTLFCAFSDAASAQNKIATTVKAKTSDSQASALANNVKKPEIVRTEAVETAKNSDAVTVINRTEADYLTGETSVSVNPKQPTVVRLGLAQNAVSIIEFPATDEIYYTHEGNPKLVSVFESPTRTTDRSIALYPGERFLPAPAGGKSPSATITLQMKSGLVIVLEVVPAPDVRSNAHRCVLNYNPAEVISARRVAGLKTNLGDESAPEPERRFSASSRLMNVAVSDVPPEAAASDIDKSEISPSSVSVEIPNRNAGRKSASPSRASGKTKSGAELSRFVQKKLREALQKADQKFVGWSRPQSGLSLSIARVAEIDDKQRLLLVAVKNETADALRLLPEMPELQIQTADAKGNALQLERLEQKYVETTALAGAISAGATVYYAIVFNAPVMGANQKLLVRAAQTEAADAPATAALNKAAKGETTK